MMHPKRKQRLLIVLTIVVGSSIAAGLLFFALSDNLNLFYPPKAIVSGEAPKNLRIRAGGMVKEGSIKRYDDGLTVDFVITDYAADVTVRYKGILPDLFGENEGAVVAGMLNDQGMLIADEVLAKHDENYMPHEVADSLQQKDQQKTQP